MSTHDAEKKLLTTRLSRESQGCCKWHHGAHGEECHIEKLSAVLQEHKGMSAHAQTLEEKQNLSTHFSQH